MRNTQLYLIAVILVAWSAWHGWQIRDLVADLAATKAGLAESREIEFNLQTELNKFRSEAVKLDHEAFKYLSCILAGGLSVTDYSDTLKESCYIRRGYYNEGLNPRYIREMQEAGWRFEAVQIGAPKGKTEEIAEVAGEELVGTLRNLGIKVGHGTVRPMLSDKKYGWLRVWWDYEG